MICCQEMMFERGMFSDVDKKQLGREMTECEVARSCRKWMLRQEKNDDRQLIYAMMQTDVMMTSEVGDQDRKVKTQVGCARKRHQI